MPPRLPEDKRQAILDDIKAGGNSCRGIARKHGVSDRVVRKIADENAVADPWSRAQTENATRARKADMAAERAELSALFLQRAREALDQMVQPHVVFHFGGKDNTYNEKTLDRPPTGDMRNLMTIAATGFDKHMARERFDSEDDAGQVASLLGTLFDGLREKHGSGDDAPAE
ncbi:hypothetical protein [Nonomuraea bangladeshensis]|uniref:hypothetical protein n=1 Tax=Nonomuraea bangladeshensis TaxID=404385 RepID=UPI003C2D4847